MAVGKLAVEHMEQAERMAVELQLVVGSLLRSMDCMKLTHFEPFWLNVHEHRTKPGQVS